MDALYEDFIIKVFNYEDKLVGKVITHGFPEEDYIKTVLADRKPYAAYVTIDKVFSLGELPFSE